MNEDRRKRINEVLASIEAKTSALGDLQAAWEAFETEAQNKWSEIQSKHQELKTELEEIASTIEEIKNEEEEAYENMPEGLQNSERGENAQTAIDALSSAQTSLESLLDLDDLIIPALEMDFVDEVKEFLEEAQGG